ncbi:hypothetical protein AURDEDRAFT_173645 [Auricularia subglabra TFB-10046 SS5]|nr:hypothetical protein AURDEDRAFT_173645 [Auricularia subglabra TFB-10046 SS5]
MATPSCPCADVCSFLPRRLADHRLCRIIQTYGNRSHRANVNFFRGSYVSHWPGKHHAWASVPLSVTPGVLLLRLFWLGYILHRDLEGDESALRLSCDLHVLHEIKRYVLDDDTFAIFRVAEAAVYGGREIFPDRVQPLREAMDDWELTLALGDLKLLKVFDPAYQVAVEASDAQDEVSHTLVAIMHRAADGCRLCDGDAEPTGDAPPAVGYQYFYSSNFYSYEMEEQLDGFATSDEEPNYGDSE